MNRILSFKRSQLRDLIHIEGVRLVLSSRIRPVLFAFTPGEKRPAMFFPNGWSPLDFDPPEDDIRPRDQAVMEDTHRVIGDLYGKDIDVPTGWLGRMITMECDLRIEVSPDGIKCRT